MTKSLLAFYPSQSTMTTGYHSNSKGLFFLLIVKYIEMETELYQVAPKKVRTSSVLFIQNQTLLKIALKEYRNVVQNRTSQ